MTSTADLLGELIGVLAGLLGEPSWPVCPSCHFTADPQWCTCPRCRHTLRAATPKRPPAVRPAPKPSRRISAPPKPSTAPAVEIVDEVAVEIAASGQRAVTLTRTERMLAARRILDHGGSTETIKARLRVSGTTAAQLAAQAGQAQESLASAA